MKGGMQTSAISSLFCHCGKETSRRLELSDKIISIHFTKKSTYWHISSRGRIKRTFKMPIEWHLTLNI